MSKYSSRKSIQNVALIKVQMYYQQNVINANVLTIWNGPIQTILLLHYGIFTIIEELTLIITFRFASSRALVLFILAH